jgi:uncharacterized protein YdhG (YjbR/CyaY superfamily)
MSKELDAYIRNAPSEQHATLHSLAGKMDREFPSTDPIMSSGFPVWTINGKWCCGFATRKKGPMIYVMATEVLDRHADVLGRLRSGQTCVDIKASKTLSLDDLDSLADVLYREARESMEG